MTHDNSKALAFIRRYEARQRLLNNFERELKKLMTKYLGLGLTRKDFRFLYELDIKKLG